MGYYPPDHRRTCRIWGFLLPHRPEFLESKNTSTRNRHAPVPGRLPTVRPPCPLLQAVTRRAKGARGERMSQFLRHFTIVGDDYHTWNINYKKWENEEDDDGEEEPPTPASGEEGRGPQAATRPPPDFRTSLRRLFSSHRFQVRLTETPNPRPMGPHLRHHPLHSWHPAPHPCQVPWPAPSAPDRSPVVRGKNESW